MPKKATFDELVAQAAAAPNSVERRRIAAKARQTVVQKKPKQHGALSQFTERIGCFCTTPRKGAFQPSYREIIRERRLGGLGLRSATPWFH